MKTLFFSVDNHQFSVEEQFLSGSQIKALAKVPVDNDLFLVVPGYKDELIEDDNRVNLARPGIERFITRPKFHGFVIIVNGTPHEVMDNTVCYRQVVELAFPNATFNATTGYTVSFAYGPHENEEGILSVGASVKIKHNMQFYVTSTHQS